MKKSFSKFYKKKQFNKKKTYLFRLYRYFFLLINKFIDMKSESKVGGTIVWNLLVPISKVIDKIYFTSLVKV